MSSNEANPCLLETYIDYLIPMLYDNYDWGLKYLQRICDTIGRWQNPEKAFFDERELDH